MNTPEPEHIDAVARTLQASHPDVRTRPWDTLDGFQRSPFRTMARTLLKSTDPAVHDALTAALHANADRARVLAAHADAGWLSEEFNVAGEDEDGGWVIDTEMSRDEASKLAARHDGFVTRRLVTRWEQTP